MTVHVAIFPSCVATENVSEYIGGFVTLAEHDADAPVAKSTVTLSRVQITVVNNSSFIKYRYRTLSTR